MPRRRRDEAVEERAGQILAESASGGQRRRRGAQQGAQTRRERRGAQAQDQAPPERGTRRNVARQPRPRVHEDLLTVAFRGPLAGKFRELAQQHEMSLSKLLQDALLSWETNVAAGYEPGTALAEWKAGQAQEGTTPD
jgi:hypothetical protein